ncbi:MAG: hypothetical protein CL858_09985 [Cupriavidus sp.]|uniref:hypothetical protein n=1 Tax=Cupriavidus pauculus TaxID=82633 RepID=UPI000C3FA609|nr:hypothetical protein [Cupriavidus pauculus]KAB0603777.1 hypothetical protein F7R19_06550 [Cupriavidus pauculus]MBU65765.1 hypothetical protein [Cupriavidus sp.]UAL03403.1 hypothetical protein K8O84_22510 [Cupriavidus pauculus]
MNKILLAATIGIAALAASSAAQAHVNFDIGIGVPAYVAAPPPPVYYAPRPVVVAPPAPVVVAPGYYDDWRAREWQERQWRREQRWREHEWRRHEWHRWHDDD